MANLNLLTWYKEAVAWQESADFPMTNSNGKTIWDRGTGSMPGSRKVNILPKHPHHPALIPCPLPALSTPIHKDATSLGVEKTHDLDWILSMVTLASLWVSHVHKPTCLLRSNYYCVIQCLRLRMGKSMNHEDTAVKILPPLLAL